MKKTVKILSFLLALVFVMSLFTGCGEGGNTADGGKEKVTIQWMWGQKLLKEETVEKGTKLTPWTPEEEGKEFQAWYERPYIKKFDFDKAVTKSMIIYASFISNDSDGGGSAAAATKVYAVLDSNWNDGSLVAAWAWPGDGWVSLTPTEDPNVFELELPEGATNMLLVCFTEGATEPNWDFQDNNRKTPDLTVPTAGSDKIYFHVSNNSWSSSSTEPGENVPAGPADIIFIGTMTGWNQGNADPAYALTKGEDGVWRGTLTLTESVELKLFDKGGSNGSGGWIPSIPAGTGENGNLVLEAGTWHFKFTEGDSGFLYWAEGDTEPEGVPSYEGETIRIYFRNNWSWPQVNCHWWGSPTANESAWPGDTMKKVEGSTDMYYLDVPADITGLLFNGVGEFGEDQSTDIKTGIVDGAAWEMSWDEATQAKNAVPITYNP